MPAIMTHDLFGKDVLAKTPSAAFDSDQAHDAFLLGCQGPDPLFYLGTSPVHAGMWRLGSQMHEERPAELVAALKRASELPEGAPHDVKRAFAHGFLCHYELDRTAHPLVYWTQDAICDAGVPGLGRPDHSEVHAFIERELDEAMLWRLRHKTVADYAPYKSLLHADEHVLDQASQMVSYMALAVYGRQAYPGLYATAVRRMRRMQHLFYSATGTKRGVLGDVEQLVRRHSMLKSMAPRPVANPDPWVANEEHRVWEDPFTGQPRDESFFDLYDAAVARAVRDIAAFDEKGFGVEQARELTDGVNFDGKPTEARIEVHQTRPLGEADEQGSAG